MFVVIFIDGQCTDYVQGPYNTTDEAWRAGCERSPGVELKACPKTGRYVDSGDNPYFEIQRVLVKGQKGQKCNRGACCTTGSQVACRHTDTDLYYCTQCARKINSHNPGLVEFPSR